MPKLVPLKPELEEFDKELIATDDPNAIVGTVVCIGKMVEERWQNGSLIIWGRRCQGGERRPIDEHEKAQLTLNRFGSLNCDEPIIVAHGANPQRKWRDLAITAASAGRLRAAIKAVVRGGKPPSREKPFWEKCRQEVVLPWFEQYGYPAPGDGKQAALERLVADWLSDRGHKAGESAIRRRVVGWIAEYRRNVGA